MSLSRGLLVVGLAVLFAGCNCGLKTCDSMVVNPCGTREETCVDGFCVVRGGSGGGGGSSGGIGGGGGATGGGVGGGGGGGTAGGGVAVLTNLLWTSPSGSTDAGSVQLTVATVPSGFDAGPSLSAVLFAPDGGGTGHTLAAVSAGVYQVPSMPTLTDGTWRAYVSSGGLDASVSFQVDRNGPNIQLRVQPTAVRSSWEVDPAMGGAFKKDEIAYVQVESNEPVSVRISDFTSPGVLDGGAGCTTGCDAGLFCSCFAVDLPNLPLLAPRGSVNVDLGSIRDAFGNASAATGTTVGVTRWKWMRQVSTSSATVTATAVNGLGQVFVGATEGVFGFTSSGAVLWSVADAGEVTAGPSIGGSTVYVGTYVASNTSSNLHALNSTTGAPGLNLCQDLTDTRIAGDLAISGTASERAFAVRSSGQLIMYSAGCPLFPMGAALTGASTLVAVTMQDGGHEAYFADTGAGSLSKYEFTGLGPWAARGTSMIMSLFPKGLFAFDGLVGGSGGPGTGGAFVTASAGTLNGTASLYSPGSSPPASAPVVGADGGFLLFGDTAGLVSRVPISGATLSGPAGTADAGANVSIRTPLLGEGKKVYLLATEGGGGRTVRVVNAQGFEWSWPTGANGGIEATQMISQMSLDVSRNGPGKVCDRPGVLYVAGAAGATARLYALIVDSKGLDPTAPWPKYQHDNANTGNAATSLSSWSCP